MRYYLDFDRTVFDTASFYIDVRERFPGASHLSNEEFGAYLNDAIDSGELSFEPGELSRYLFPDAARFLRDKENAASIVTFGNQKLQEAKVKSAIYGIPRIAAMYTGGMHKGTYLAPHTHLHTDALFVDDTAAELEILESSCPGIRLYEMRRDGGAGDGRWPVIRSFAEVS